MNNQKYRYKVSIGFPVYNVEKYVHQSLESILDQDFDDYEIIVVDDCGNDNSMKIIEDLTSIHPKGNSIRIIKHDKNAGLAQARNTAINNASGKYIYFVDSDDVIVPNAIKILYDIAEKYQAEVVVGSNYKQKGDHIWIEKGNIQNDMYFVEKNGFKDYLYRSLKNDLPTTAWNILFSTEFLNLNNLRFPDIRFQEDIAFDELYHPYIQRIAFVSYPTYIYQFRTDSLMNFQHRERIGINEVHRSIELCNIIKQSCIKWKGDPYYGGICAKTLKRCFFQIAGILKHRNKFSEDIDDIIIRDMISHPESLSCILGFKQLFKYNIFCYILGKLPPRISIFIISQICKKKGYLKTNYQKDLS